MSQNIIGIIALSLAISFVLLFQVPNKFTVFVFVAVQLVGTLTMALLSK